MRPYLSAVLPVQAMAGLVWLAAGVACGGATPASRSPAPASALAETAAASDTAAASETAAPAPAPALPATTASGDEPAATAPDERATRTLGAMRDGFNAHDAARVAENFTDDCVVDPYTGPELHGRAELAGDLERTFGAFGDARVALLRGWVKDDVVVSEVAWTGAMTGNFLGVKANHKPAGLVAVRVLKLTGDGLVKEMHEYGDAAGLVAQMKGKTGAPAPPILPTNELPLHVARGTPDEDQLVTWAKRLDEAYGAGDVKGVLALMSDDADYWTNFGGPAVRGKRALEKSVGGWLRAFPDQKWEVTGVWGIDGFVIIEHAMTGTQLGPFEGNPATKKLVAGWRRLDILQPAVGGTVLHGWGFANVMEMMKQTGALKQPGDSDTTHLAPATARKKGAPPVPR
jgi:ketosteroid isomerase-like protein